MMITIQAPRNPTLRAELSITDDGVRVEFIRITERPIARRMCVTRTSLSSEVFTDRPFHVIADAVHAALVQAGRS
jgi:hypothetical protein